MTVGEGRILPAHFNIDGCLHASPFILGFRNWGALVKT